MPGDVRSGRPTCRASDTDPMDEVGFRLRRRWTAAFVVGEMIGFVPPAVTGAVLAAQGAGDVALVVGLVLAGSLEGAALGWTQSAVLARALPGLARLPWIVATSLAAAAAWLAGMGGVAVIQAVGPAALVVVGPGFVAGLLAMGVLQWWVLRRHVAGAGRWITVTSGAWLVGVMIPVVALSGVPDGWPLPVHVVVGVASAVLMGLTVGLLTGATLVRLLGRRSETPVVGRYVPA